ncbi:MAG: Crp/Fnr family transcriptional regulator [Bacteroidia bacterium]|nr:Crp/Fnr family transcriptional regulator [Bacteroidia bacterium]
MIKPEYRERLLAHIGRYVQLPAEEAEYFVSLVSHRSTTAREILLRQCDIANESYFVLEGCIRAYTLDNKADEHVMHLATNDWWITDMYSLITRKPGNYTIECLEASEVLVMPREKQWDIYDKYPRMERYFRVLMENAYVSTLQRIHDNLSLSAEERYLNFERKFPGLVHRIPNKHIASYIGVTPEFFSKMKKRMLKNS